MRFLGGVGKVFHSGGRPMRPTPPIGAGRPLEQMPVPPARTEAPPPPPAEKPPPPPDPVVDRIVTVGRQAVDSGDPAQAETAFRAIAASGTIESPPPATHTEIAEQTDITNSMQDAATIMAEANPPTKWEPWMASIKQTDKTTGFSPGGVVAAVSQGVENRAKKVAHGTRQALGKLAPFPRPLDIPREGVAGKPGPPRITILTPPKQSGTEKPSLEGEVVGTFKSAEIETVRAEAADFLAEKSRQAPSTKTPAEPAAPQDGLLKGTLADVIAKRKEAELVSTQTREPARENQGLLQGSIAETLRMNAGITNPSASLESPAAVPPAPSKAVEGVPHVSLNGTSAGSGEKIVPPASPQVEASKPTLEQRELEQEPGIKVVAGMNGKELGKIYVAQLQEAQKRAQKEKRELTADDYREIAERTVLTYYQPWAVEQVRGGIGREIVADPLYRQKYEEARAKLAGKGEAAVQLEALTQYKYSKELQNSSPAEQVDAMNRIVLDNTQRVLNDERISVQQRLTILSKIKEYNEEKDPKKKQQKMWNIMKVGGLLSALVAFSIASQVFQG